MKSKEYWAHRAALDMVDHMGMAETAVHELRQAAASAEKYLSDEAKKVFNAFQGFGISEQEARTILRSAGNGKAMNRLRKAAANISDPEARKAFLDALNSAGAYRWRINRIEELNKDIDRYCEAFGRAQNQTIEDVLGDIAGSSYYHSIYNIQRETGLGFSFSTFSRSEVNHILHKNWSGASYSDRIWSNTDALAGKLKSELLISAMSGRSADKTARVIADTFNNSIFNARRLVRTESAYVANAATLTSYDEAEIEKYIFMATLDMRTSEVCAKLDGREFPCKDAKPGTNYPPMHPWCRSYTISSFGPDTLKGLERRARDENGELVKVPADMTYNEWAEKFCPEALEFDKKYRNEKATEESEPEKDSSDVDKSAESDIINLNSNNIGENVEITDEAIENVPLVELSCLSAENNQKFQQANKDILAEAAKHEVGTEVSAIYRLSDMSQIGKTIIGEEGAGTVKLASSNEKYIGVHNHPDGSTISLPDFEAFWKSGNMAAISAVTNEAHVHVLEVSQDPDKYVDVIGYVDYVYDAKDKINVMGYSIDDYKNDLVDFSEIDKSEFCSQLNEKIIAIWKAGADYGFRYYYK